MRGVVSSTERRQELEQVLAPLADAHVRVEKFGVMVRDHLDNIRTKTEAAQNLLKPLMIDFEPGFVPPEPAPTWRLYAPRRKRLNHSRRGSGARGGPAGSRLSQIIEQAGRSHLRARLE